MAPRWTRKVSPEPTRAHSPQSKRHIEIILKLLRQFELQRQPPLAVRQGGRWPLLLRSHIGKSAKVLLMIDFFFFVWAQTDFGQFGVRLLSNICRLIPKNAACGAERFGAVRVVLFRLD